MTIHLDCYATTDCKPEMLSGVETGNRIPHDEWNLRGIAHIYRKDDIFMQRRLMQIFTLKDFRNAEDRTRRWLSHEYLIGEMVKGENIGRIE